MISLTLSLCLFLPLQTNPAYLAKLIFQMPQNKSTKFMDTVIFTLYNYASNQREEYLLLKLFKSALEEEIKWGHDSSSDRYYAMISSHSTLSSYFNGRTLYIQLRNHRRILERICLQFLNTYEH